MGTPTKINLALAATSVMLGAASCHGSLNLDRGVTLCDREHPCQEGHRCTEGVCVVDRSGGDNRTSLGDSLVVDLGDATIVPPPALVSCRIDAQCTESELCIEGKCVPDPCLGVEPAPGEVCTYRCRATENACDGIVCVDNREHCLAGQCVPLCSLDPCGEGGCIPGVDNCDPSTRTCMNDTFCSLGVCEPNTIMPCDSAACPAGFECVVETRPFDPCDPNPCNAGWACRDLGEDAFTCIAITCSGVNCPVGETCIGAGGTPVCRDLCADLPCALGGQQGCNTDAVCCDRECCPNGFVCEMGECVPPDLTCDPVCEEDEICLPDGCFCGPNDSLQGCGSNQCCLGDMCGNPCLPNPCDGEPVNRGCDINCDDPLGYECIDLCDGVTCVAPDTCDPDTGQCSCGGTTCQSAECCVMDVCTDPCDPDPCDGSLPELTGQCTTSCGLGSPYFECVNLCDGVTCPINRPECDPTTGQCGCGTAATQCNGSQCCLPDGGSDETCQDPCPGLGPSNNPCYPIACQRDCSAQDGRTCFDPCGPTSCQADPRNPECNSETGSCQCGGSACGGGNNCCVAGSCTDPCGPGSPGAMDCAGQNLACTRDCTVPSGYVCEDLCDSVTCDDRNPVCNPTTAQCRCDDGDLCVAPECCNGSSCADPCVENPCPSGGYPADWYGCAPDCSATMDRICFDLCDGVTCQPGATCNPLNGVCTCDGTNDCPNTGSNCCVAAAPNMCDVDPCNPDLCDPMVLDCEVDCTQADGYNCIDRCVSVTCPNPDREPDCDGRTGECLCGTAPGGVQCNGGSRCCLSGSCELPCNPNECGPGNPYFPSDFYRCVVDCNDVNGDGYRCEDFCAGGGSCTQPNPDCDPVSNNSCNCGGDAGDPVCGPDECCNAGSCFDPCMGDPCGGTGACVPDCSGAPWYTCEDQCIPNNCAQPEPDCDPVTGDCSCDGTSCGGNNCCISDSCVDPCAGDPCGATGACIRDCSQPAGYVCQDQCVPDPCDARNPDCDSVTGSCSCNGSPCNGSQCCNAGGTACESPCAGNPCGDTGSCVVDCTQPNNRRCVDQCGGVSCGQPNPDCYPPSGNCGCGLTSPVDSCQTGLECCLSGMCDNPCDADPCDTGTDRRCNLDCGEPTGFFCDDACVGVTCNDLIQAPHCNNETGMCGCGVVGSFETCGAGTVCCGASPAESTCVAQVCDPNNPTACTPPLVCDPCVGCFDPSGG